MRNAERFPFKKADDIPGEAGLIPYLPITLIFQDRSINSSDLLDTGATVNVLPYQIGLELGAEWEQKAATIRLSGNLAQL